MKSYSSREVIKMLKADGWYEVTVAGSHHPIQASIQKGAYNSKTPRQRYSN